MSDEEVREAVAEILEEVSDLDADEVRMDSALGSDLDVDSLLMVEVLVAVEERFAITVPDEAASEMTTVGDLVAFVQAQEVAA